VSDDKAYLAYAAAYSSTEDAQADFKALKRLKAEGEIRDLTAAIVLKDENGKVRTHNTRGLWKGWVFPGLVGALGGGLYTVSASDSGAGIAIIGAIIGAVVAIVVLVSIGYLAGAVLASMGYRAGAASRKDLRELGSHLDDGEAAILAVAVDSVSTDVDNALGKAARKASKEVDKGDVSKAIEELEKGLDKAGEAAS
jgi:hypothetical protein